MNIRLVLRSSLPLSSDMRSLLVILVVTILSASASSQPQSLVDQFERRSQVHEGFRINYRLFVPANYDPGTAYPLVLALHGSGERGTDNEAQIGNHRMATAWADLDAQGRNPAFVVAPQAPPGGSWTADFAPPDQPPSPPRPEMATVYAILDSLANEFNIDTDRVYVTGLSMGGFGTFEAVFKAQGRFAAAVPLSGGYPPVFAEGMLDVPFWIIHGDTDQAVDVFWSRVMVAAFQELGRSSVYTHCAPFACNILSSTQLANALAKRPNLVYSELPGQGHVIWAPWYDNPLLQDWMFAQHRLTDTIDVTSISASTPGTTRMDWLAPNPVDTVDIWITDDLGRSWSLLDSGPNDGFRIVDTGGFIDTPFARARLDLVDAEGFVYARYQTDSFTIDNSGDGAPVVAMLDLLFWFVDVYEAPTLTLNFVAGDAESSSLAGTLLFSEDGGDSFVEIDTFDITTSTEVQSIDVDMQPLPNTEEAIFRLEVSDGSNVAMAQTPSFNKQTERVTSEYVEHTEGTGVATIVINFVSPADLTGHRYRITFGVPDEGPKTYTVRDLDTGTRVLVDVPITEGEGPEFDGIRLSINDLEKAKADDERSAWTTGDANVDVGVSAPRVNIENRLVDLLATPADYRITIADAVVDTSSALFGFPANPMQFTVENVTSGGLREILYTDRNGDGIPGPGDRFYILEEDDQGDLMPAWLFAVGRGTISPEPGDVYSFFSLKPVTGADVFEFIGQIGVATETERPSNGFSLGQNFPNPFSASTTIPFTLDAPGDVELTVHDVLGRKVLTLIDGVTGAGDGSAIWHGSGLPAGVYFVRLRSGDRVSVVRATKMR